MSAVVGVTECGESVACELKRIADAMSGFDLNGFLTTLLATLIGAGVAAVVTLWLNRRERPRPVWRVETVAGWEWRVERDGTTILVAQTTNIGDGNAYNVLLEILGAQQNGPARADVVEPGESVNAEFYVPAGGELRLDEETGAMIDNRTLVWPQGMKLRAEWQQPPNRHQRRHAKFALDNPLSRE